MLTYAQVAAFLCCRFTRNLSERPQACARSEAMTRAVRTSGRGAEKSYHCVLGFCFIIIIITIIIITSILILFYVFFSFF